MGTSDAVHRKAVGDRSEAEVLAALVHLFPTVLMPWGENQRYDFVVDQGPGEFARIQVKTGRLRDGAVRFNTCSFAYHHPRNRGTRHYKYDYRGDADLFAVFCPETDAVYLVPVDELPKGIGVLRVDPPKNNQRTGIRFASDYQVHPPG